MTALKIASCGSVVVAVVATSFCLKERFTVVMIFPRPVKRQSVSIEH